MIYKSGLAKTWEAQVEEAVENESDEFWEEVCSLGKSLCTSNQNIW